MSKKINQAKCLEVSSKLFKAWLVVSQLTSKTAVANFLRKKKIKGERQNSSACPLSVYFLKAVNVDGASASVDSAVIFTLPDNKIFRSDDIELPITNAMDGFVSAFDSRKYKDLILLDENGDEV